MNQVMKKWTIRRIKRLAVAQTRNIAIDWRCDINGVTTRVRMREGRERSGADNKTRWEEKR